MSNSRVLSIAILTAITVNVYSQGTQTDTVKKLAPLPSLMAGVGVLYFNGNFNPSGVTAYTTVRGGYTFGVEERPIPMLGIQLNGLIGKLAAGERSDDTTKNKNFESNILQGELTVNLHFFNKPTAVISPFIYAGISFMSYKTYTDSLSAAGTPYWYWTDGSIRNLPQNAGDITKAQIIQRDYVYETSRGGGSSMSVPVGLGAKIHITDNICMNIQAAYYFAFTNKIEYYATAGGGNEKYLFSFCTLEYHFTHKVVEQEDPHYRNTDFTQIDTKDNVQKSELTKEQEDALLAKESQRDTNSVEHSEADFFSNPNSAAGKKIIADKDKGATSHAADPNKLPARFRSADKNHDGYITSQEITQTIDEFFDGTSPMTIADINALIDYFFDQ